MSLIRLTATGDCFITSVYFDFISVYILMLLCKKKAVVLVTAAIHYHCCLPVVAKFDPVTHDI